MMAPRALTATALLMLLLVTLSGCTTPEERQGDDPETTADPAGDSTSDTTDSDGTSEAEEDGTTVQPTEPAQAEDPAAPGDREQDSPDDVDQAGEYALLPYRDGRDTTVSTDVPTWGDGWSWTYEVRIPLVFQYYPTCTDATPFIYEYEFTETGTSHGFEAYRLAFTSTSCDGQDSTTSSKNHTRANLNPIEDNGAAVMRYVFPLEDGKRWMYLDDRDDEVVAEVEHLPDHEHDGGTRAAWKVTHTKTHDGNETRTIWWYDAEVRMHLRHEIRIDDEQYCDSGEDCLILESDLAAYEAGS